MADLKERLQKDYETNCAQAKIWLDAIEDYSPERFKYKPSPRDWSIGQVYFHLLIATHQFFIPSIEKALAGKKTENGAKKLPGKLMLFFNSFPPIRIRLPEKIAKDAPKEFTTELHQPRTLGEVRIPIQELPKTYAKLRDRIAREYKPDRKILHPALGWLDAEEWFRLNEMHWRHHLRQKKRIDEALRKTNLK